MYALAALRSSCTNTPPTSTFVQDRKPLTSHFFTNTAKNRQIAASGQIIFSFMIKTIERFAVSASELG